MNQAPDQERTPSRPFSCLNADFTSSSLSSSRELFDYGLSPSSTGPSAENATPFNPYKTPKQVLVLCSNGCGKTFTQKYSMVKHVKKMRCSLITKPHISDATAELKRLQQMLATSEAEKIKLLTENTHLRTIQSSYRYNPYSELSGRQKQRRRSELMRDLLLRSGKDEDSDMLLRDFIKKTLGKRFLVKLLDGKFGLYTDDSKQNYSELLFNSQANRLRSSRIIFHNQEKMSRKTYRNVKDAIESIGNGNFGTKLLSYEGTMAFLRREIKYIRTELHSTNSLIPTAAPSVMSSGNGRYRDLRPTVIRSAEKFLRAAFKEIPTIQFKWCGPEFCFNLAVGADGFPYFKKTMTAFALSFLDLGSRVHSPESLMLLFLGDYKESHEACTTYCRTLAGQMKELELSKPIPFTLPNGQKIEYKFKFSALVGDQSWQMSATGMGGCSSRYFSPFLNVCKAKDKNQLRIINGTVGKDFSEWTFDQRLKFVEKVQKYLENYTKKNGRAPSDTIFNDFVYGLGTSQKEHPPVDWLCDFAYVCSLHIGINVVKTFFRGLIFGFVKELTTFLKRKKVTCPKRPFPSFLNSVKYSAMERISNEEQSTGQLGIPYVVLVKSLRNRCRLKRVGNQIEKLWNFDAKDLGQFHIQGEDVRMFCHFMPWLTGTVLRQFLGKNLSFPKDYLKQVVGLRQRLAFLHFCSILLRNILSLINQTEMTETDVSDLETLCRFYQNVTASVANKSSFDFHNQAVWTLTHMAPFHARKIFKELNGKGLGLVSMQGREHLHLVIKSFLKRTIWQDQFTQVHESIEVTTNYLPEQFGEVGVYYEKGGHGNSKTYIPFAAQDISRMDLHCEIENCTTCEEYRDDLLKAADLGEIKDSFARLYGEH